MGVRSFFWWFLNKYPKTLSDALETRGEFDNFYIDLNEIIHPCFRPDDVLFPPTSFDEIFWSLYQHIDRLFDLVRPRKLLFIAVDGVASRAKMNLIRAGRFGFAKSIDMAAKINEKLREQFEQEGKSLLSKKDLQGIDPTVITPGTEFMQMLSEKLQSYICLRMSEDSAWGNIKVILSDDKVPGEGEHKIMSFIRSQRTSPGYDPNTRHCVYGTDTDLIMLALATHEVHFSILREEPVRERRVCQFLNVCVLREYLALDLEIPSSDECEYDLERIIDDFIFICFFAGNDFLPRMPTLQTHEGCIDLLMHVYKIEFQNFGGYLVDMQKAEDETGGCINFKGVERFILTVGAYEDKIFSKRSQIRNSKLRRALGDSRKAKDYEKDHQDDGRVSRILAKYAIVDSVDGVFRNTVELLLEVEHIHAQYNLLKDGIETDKVIFGTHGWRERYYKEKFSAETPEEIEATRNTLVAKYCEGLCWVLLCYFSGVPSWSWFYPYYYSPLASDLEGLSQIKVEFQKGLPFKPFDQLLGVLPPSRAHLLPEAYKGLMIDKNWKIAYFYTTKLDKESGKSCPWQDIKHSSIEEDLLSEKEKLENELKDHEKIRNLETLDLLFVKRSSEASQQVVWGSGTRAASNKIKGAVMMNSTIEGIQGVLHLMPEDLIDADDDNERECSRNVLCMFYETNQDFQHVPQLLEGINIPQKTVKKEDIVVNNLWHEQYGSASAGNRFQNRRQLRPDQKSEHYSQGGSEISSGRGKTYVASHLDRAVGELKPEEHTSSSLRPNYGNRHHQPSEYNTRSIAGSSRRDGYGGTENHRESDTNLRPMSNNRSRQGGSSFWPSRSGVTYDANDDWRSNKQSGAAPGGTWHKNSEAQTQRPNGSYSSNMGSGRWK